MISPYTQLIKLCDSSNLNEIKSFYYKNIKNINLTKYNCYIFRYICETNKINILEWLFY